MKRIITNGITNLEPLPGSSEWYWGADYASNDLYEAEELFRSGHPIEKNRLVLVHCPEGTVYAPVRTKSGQDLGRPVYHDGRVVLLMVDFPKEKIRILTFYEATETTELLVVLPLSIVAYCYNLMLEASPLMPAGNCGRLSGMRHFRWRTGTLQRRSWSGWRNEETPAHNFCWGSSTGTALC